MHQERKRKKEKYVETQGRALRAEKPRKRVWRWSPLEAEPGKNWQRDGVSVGKHLAFPAVGTWLTVLFPIHVTNADSKRKRINNVSLQYRCWSCP